MTDGFEALRAGRGVVALDGWRLTLVRGADARGWLHDLLTADVAGVAEGAAVRSLLLSPTGRVRADVQVLGIREGLLLLQDPIQPQPIDGLLAPYVLSSDVTVEDRAGDWSILAVPGSPDADAGAEAGAAVTPSVLGPGVDLVVPRASRDDALERLRREGRSPAAPDDAERFRIWSGRVRFGVDLDGSHLPAEAGLEATIDVEKGCFLGQESVARVRNLGHPPTVLRWATHRGPPAADPRVHDATGPVGTVTSAARADDHTRAFIRVPWAARGAALRLADGRALRDLPQPD